MNNINRNRPGRYSLLFLLVVVFFFSSISSSFAQPQNDSCTNATLIPIPLNGYGLGTFTSTQSNMAAATVQAGETFAPAIFVAGLNKRSVWYKFSIPTIRAVRVTLTQPGTTITAGDVGFSVYQANSCMPGNADISTKLTPIVTFGNTYHPCVPSGEYLIQVTSNNNANGPITIEVEISDQTGAAYDHPDQAYAFGQVKNFAQRVDFNTECQSIEDATEVCSAFTNPMQYNKSAWMTFTTPAYFDYIVVQLSGTGSTTYFPSNNNQPIKRSFGYSLYQGNAVTTPINSLSRIQGCDSVVTDGYYAAYKVYKCNDLLPNTTYTIQLFIHKDFGDDVRLGIVVGGQVPTKGDKPMLANIPSPNAIGNLPASPNGTLTRVDDVWGCNARHNMQVCGSALPDSGIVHNNIRYNLSSFFTFTLTTTCAVNFNAYVTQCGPQALVRVFKQGVTNNCSDLDTSNLAGVFLQNGTIDCLEPGNYTVQVLGRDDTDWYGRFHYGTPTYNAEQCLVTNLGTSFRLDINAYNRKAANKFSLDTIGAVDSINVSANVMQPLQHGVGYLSTSDTMGCMNTVRPADTTCSPSNSKVIYREFVVADSGVVDFSNLVNHWAGNWKYRLYSGDASALAWAQNAFDFPDKITGLKAVTECMSGWTDCTNKRACVVPGTYTFATMGGEPDVGRVDQPRFTFLKTRTKHYSPETAQDLGSIMDTLGAGGGTITTDLDDWSCTDNAVPINGVIPCIIAGKPATKAIYRQFYLKEAALVRIDNTYYWYCTGKAYGTRSLFYGKATDGMAGLSPVDGWSCFGAAGSTAGCDLLPAGWYTVVSHNQGPSYDSTFRSLNIESRYNSSVSYNDEFRITITPTCPGPQYNRPFKAATGINHKPFLITRGDRPGGTPAYPKRDSAYTLPTENFNCLVDTPFSNHRVKACLPSHNRVAYYVFQTTQVSFVSINARGFYAVLYDRDVRSDSALFDTLRPIQTCNNIAGLIQFCHFQPGIYTLVIFAGNGDVCKSVAPIIYIDEVGVSRFDYANNAYDFGVVPADSSFHFGKVGEVNPVDTGRAASHDYFYCTTGAFASDPGQAVCYTAINPNIYNGGPNKPMYDSAFPPSNTIPRRNLWFTFVVDQPGYVRVKVDGRGARKAWQHKFAVFQSDVDGTLPFSSVVSTGQVDSTMAQGLTHLATNQQTWYYCANLTNEISFFRDPCTSVATRYYVLVENVNGEPYENGGALPNTQIEVAVMVDSVNLVLPKHNRYFEAGDLGTVGVGRFKGDVDNYSCATRDATDPMYHYSNYSQCRKTLWYKFTSTITGNVRYRININGTWKNDYWDVQLFKQIIPGDSTSAGLQFHGYQSVWVPADNTYWSQTCVSRGTYYLLLTGCDKVGEYVYPEIELIEATGDFCSRAVVATLNGAGSLSASLVVDCHTIGTDYGEFGPNVTCPQGGKTAEYKSSWFRMDIGGTDTLDVTTYLVESTNAASSDIKYRLMTGDCGAMQEQSCVLDALTQNTYQCLVPGQSYYVQVFTPISKFNQAVTGNIELKLSAVPHVDTCAPSDNCLANANFTTQFDCTTDTAVRFINFSTFGSSVQYSWDFGYAGQTSAEVSPSFSYPELERDTTYSIKLRVENLSCGKKDSIVNTIMIPGRPKIDLGIDTVFCSNNVSLNLDATTWNGTTYQWSTNAATPTITVNSQGSNLFWVKGTFNGCITTDTIWVSINPITPRKEEKVICNAGDSVQLTSTRNQGELHNWTNGTTAPTLWAKKAGTFYNYIKWYGCTIIDTFSVAVPTGPFPADSFVCFNTQVKLDATSVGAVSYQWQNGAGGATFNISAPGQYWVQVNYPGCSIRDTINVTGLQPVITTTSAAICQGGSYTLPSGRVVNLSGTYSDTAWSVSGCDSAITSVVLTVRSVINQVTSQTICQGQNYTLPWGATINAAGIYNDTTRYYSSSCDSLIRQVLITENSVLHNNSSATICGGQNFTLPSGRIVSLPGIFYDTLRYASGCDSLVNIIDLRVLPLMGATAGATICPGETYTLPSGKTVATTGVYNDTIRYGSGCDSLVTIVTLTVRPVTRTSLAASVCAGNNYVLPSGVMVNTSGTYADTLHYLTGCDSVVYSINLVVQPLTRINSDIEICEGQTYTLPSGSIVSTSGVFIDTLKYTTGCDSIIRTTQVQVRSVARVAINQVICASQSYTLPSGRVVNATGVYSDTMMYKTGCDSLVTTLNLAVLPLTRRAVSPTICEGSAYTLPGGKIISIGGNYFDTLRYTNGCDSLITNVVLTVKAVIRSMPAVTICDGQSYTLPSGRVVNATGIYADTVKYASGCDSLVSTIRLTLNTLTRASLTPVICEGQTFTSPSGKQLTASGNYSDTLRYANGCDSIITSITLTVKGLVRLSVTASICQGGSHTLPSGKVVTVQGIYRDTLRYATGCDSVIHTTNLLVKPVTRTSVAASLCAGQSYLLPSGWVVNDAGTYRDTVRYALGCDSLVTTAIITMRTAITNSFNHTICEGQFFTLPSGKTVIMQGVHRDTIRFASGCDSLLTIVNLTVKPVIKRTISANICEGEIYTAPSGATISTTGIFHHVIKYRTGCDSLVTTINLLVNAPRRETIQPAICQGETYTMPSGNTASTTGTYNDVIKNSTGCDSVVTTVHLVVNANPVVQLSKTNDINCIVGTTTLSAKGGSKGVWYPATGLSHPNALYTVAAPQVTTMYKATITTTAGCTAIDSIQVTVNKGDAEGGYVLPTAFSPNGDNRNDCFGVKTWGWITDLQFSIFDRWGNMLFATSDPAKCWDGTYNGTGLGTGAYVYSITANTICGPVVRKGTIVLIK